MRGPIDYLIVEFEGNKFDGSILSALGEAIEKGVIDVLSLAVVAKDNDGAVTTLDIEDTGDEFIVEFTHKYLDDPEPVSDEDVEEISELLANNTAAGFLVVEQLWAKPLKAAILKANGKLVAEGRIHPAAAEELNEETGE